MRAKLVVDGILRAALRPHNHVMLVVQLADGTAQAVNIKDIVSVVSPSGETMAVVVGEYSQKLADAASTIADVVAAKQGWKERSKIVKLN